MNWDDPATGVYGHSGKPQDHFSYYCAMVIPALSDMAFYGESILPGQLFGIALMVASFVCAVDTQNEESGTSLKWLLLCLGSFLFSGSVDVMQKVHQTGAHKDELGVFLVIAFVVSALFSYMLCLISHAHPRQKAKNFVWVSLVCGAAFVLVNQINMYLASAMPAIIFYPVVNGSGMILTTAAGLLLWKEKLSRRQTAGLVLGGIAIILLCGLIF